MQRKVNCETDTAQKIGNTRPLDQGGKGGWIAVKSGIGKGRSAFLRKAKALDREDRYLVYFLSEYLSITKFHYPGVAQLVARLLWEQDAAGSNPVTRTKR